MIKAPLVTLSLKNKPIRGASNGSHQKNNQILKQCSISSGEVLYRKSIDDRLKHLEVKYEVAVKSPEILVEEAAGDNGDDGAAEAARSPSPPVQQQRQRRIKPMSMKKFYNLRRSYLNKGGEYDRDRLLGNSYNFRISQ